jgi:hypothetical protein
MVPPENHHPRLRGIGDGCTEPILSIDPAIGIFGGINEYTYISINIYNILWNVMESNVMECNGMECNGM